MKFVGSPVNTVLRKRRTIRKKNSICTGDWKISKKLGTTSDNSTNTEYYECKERLMEIEKVKAEGAIIRSKVKFIEEGEKKVHSMLKETLIFYEKLYKAKKYSEEEDNRIL